MSNLIASDIQKLEQDAIVVMFELDASKFGGGLMRFSPTSVDGSPVRFGGVEYLPLPIEADGFAWSGTGTLPRPTLTLAGYDLSLLGLVVNADDLVGCPVVRIRTYRRYLDDGETPNPDARYEPDHYVIERKAAQTRTTLQFELSAAMDQQGRMIPARQVLRDSCSHKFRYWANDQWNYTGVTCPYAGGTMYNRAGVETTDPTKARCGKRVSDCKAHFGSGAVLPFYGFPGVGRL